MYDSLNTQNLGALYCPWDKVKLPSVGVFRRTGCASAGVATGRRVFSLRHPH